MPPKKAAAKPIKKIVPKEKSKEKSKEKPKAKPKENITDSKEIPDELEYDDVEDGPDEPDEPDETFVSNDETPEARALEKKQLPYKFKPVVRKNIVLMHPDNRVTSNVMTRFEYTEVVGIRARQIEKGGTCFTDTAGITDPLEKAKKEIMDKRCPLSVKRALVQDQKYELWHVNEMSLPPDVL